MKELSAISQAPEWEAREIIFHITGKSLADFLVVKDVQEDYHVMINKVLKKRREGIPLYYILNNVSFMGIDLYVNEHVLIPRNETEMLVEELLKEKRGKVLEIGTGSGAIAIALALHGFEVVATDISKDALTVAKLNARSYHVSIDFRNGRYFKCIKDTEKFDYIVSNPPYISLGEYKKLPKEVKMEPRVSLVSPLDGMWHSYRIMTEGRKHLKSGGVLFLEISPHRVEKYVQAAYSLGYSEVQVIKDLTGNFRVLKTRWE